MPMLCESRRMTDPQFQTRADLEAWASHLVNGYTSRNPTKRQRAQFKRIRRVTIAHLHLPEIGQ